MSKPAIIFALGACALAAACGAPGPTAKTSNTNSRASNTQTSIQHGPSPSADAGVAASHGGAAPAGGPAAKPSVETPEMDAKIEKAEAKAKAAGASDADKKSAARAYFERADFYRGEGTPALYKFALADYRRGLRYDPADEAARGKMDEIVAIYKSMGRPVPELGNEQ
ncbi:MAG TPA: hypothetical protein VM914_11470 [Pyrinomonadaceae bacterium]|nr:hypothetical protein [Pyrinomonadaceae bacterium]